MSPYIDEDGNTIRRVTEVIGARQCEATAYIEKDTKGARTRTTHLVVLPGTIAHAKVEQYIVSKMMGKKAETLRLSDTDKKLFAQIRVAHNKQKKVNPDEQTTYDDIMEKVRDCYANFLVFKEDHPFTPLLVEERMYSSVFPNVGGTVDLIALFHKVKGYVLKTSPLPDYPTEEKPLFPHREYFKICDHAGKCECEEKDVVVVLDWKTSVRKQEGHRIQMSAYFTMAEENGLFDKYRDKGYMISFDTWSVLLGKHSYKKKKDPYQLIYYESYAEDFLASCDLHDNAKYTTRNHLGKSGLKGRCMFCSHIINCPDRLNWNIDNKEVKFIPLTTQHLAQLSFLLNQHSPDLLKEVSDIISYELEVAQSADKEVDELIPTLLQEFESELGLKIEE